VESRRDTSIPIYMLSIPIVFYISFNYPLYIFTIYIFHVAHKFSLI